MRWPLLRALRGRRRRQPAHRAEPATSTRGTTDDPQEHEGSSVDAVPDLAERTADPAPDVEAAVVNDSTERGELGAGFRWAPRERNPGEGEPVRIGAPSTFGTADWWSSGWWPAGDARGDVHADLATRGALAIAGVALRGNKHRLTGEACEDAFHIRPAGTAENPFVCIAVCDGVGNAAQSRLGARWLSELVTEHLARAIDTSENGPASLEPEAARSAVTDAVAMTRSRAESRAIPLSEVQTTLTFAIIPAAETVSCQGMLGQVGDSPAFVWASHGWSTVGEATDHDEPILSTRTNDALSADLSHMPVTSFDLDAGGRLLLCTDGIGNFIRSSASMLDLGAHLGAVLQRPVPLTELVRQADFDLRSADDDRTMVIVWRKSLEPSAR